MYYVYILLGERDGNFYIGNTNNLRIRFSQHCDGKVESTKNRRPLKLAYYEGYLSKEDAQRNEKYYKTTKGREDLRKKLKSILEKYRMGP